MSATTNPWLFSKWIAHRGAGKLAPENTLAAFRVGASHGFRAFECDVKLSADGVPFLLHDDTLERTTNAQGAAGERLWSELSLLDAGSWHSPAYAGELIPSFEAIAQYVLSSNFAIDVEIKPTPGLERETGRVVAREAARLWARYGSHQSVPPLLSSFQVDSLVGAHRAAPELPRALLVENLPPGWFEQACELRCVAVVASHELIDCEMVDRLHAAGMRVLTYTVNEKTEAERLLRLGIDGLITDALGQFSAQARLVV